MTITSVSGRTDGGMCDRKPSGAMSSRGLRASEGFVRIGLKPMGDGAVMDGASFGDPEGDGLLACHTLHEAIGDALVVGRSLVHRARDEWCADAYG